MKTKTLFLVAVAVFATLVGGFLYVALGGSGDERRLGALSPSYSAGKFALEVNGVMAGWLKDVAGCGVEAPTREIQTTVGYDKQPGATAYGTCQMRFGMSMTPAFYKWVGDAIRGAGTSRNVSIVQTDFNYKEIGRLELTNALISRFTLPALGGPAEALYFEVALAPLTIRSLKGSGAAVSSSLVQQKIAQTSYFRATIGDLPSAKVAPIDAWSVNIPVPERSGELMKVAAPRAMAGDLSLAVSEADADAWQGWVETSLIQGNPSEKSATIEILNATLDQVFAKFSLTGVGLQAADLFGKSPTSDGAKKRAYTLYVESATASFTP